MIDADCAKPLPHPIVHHAAPAAGAVHRYFHPRALVETNCERIEPGGDIPEPLPEMTFERIEQAGYSPTVQPPATGEMVPGTPLEPVGDVGTELGALPMPGLYGAPSPILVSVYSPVIAYPLTPAVPEPGSWAMLLAGVIWLARRVKAVQRPVGGGRA